MSITAETPISGYPKKVLLAIRPKMLIQLDEIARARGLNRSELVRAILAEWINRQVHAQT